MKPLNNKLIGNRNLDNLLLADTLEYSMIGKLVLNASLILLIFILLIFFWSSFVKIDEVSMATGKIIPSGDLLRIQHLEGGIVEQVYVKNGQTVVKGQPLISLNSVATDSTLQELRCQQLATQISILRLSFFVKGEKLTKEKIIAALQKTGDFKLDNYQDFINNEIQLNYEQTAVKNSNIEELKHKLKKAKEDLLYAQQNLKNLEHQKDLATEKREIFVLLRANKSISELDYLEAKDKETNILGQILDGKSKVKSLADTVKVAQAQLDTLESSQLEKALQELTESQAQLLSIKSNIISVKDKQTRSKILSPIDGSVQHIEFEIGTVIPPKGVIMELIPLDKPLVAKVRIDPKDIGHVEPGNNVHIKLSAYNYSQYGSLLGKIKQVSSTTFDDKKNGPYYEGIIELTSNYNNPKENVILPGMMLTADIITEKRTILQYLMHPVKNALENAFRER